MARIAGVNIPTKKRVLIALTYIYGIGSTSSKKICEEANLISERRVADLSDEEVTRIREIIDRDVSKKCQFFNDVDRASTSKN